MPLQLDPKKDARLLKHLASAAPAAPQGAEQEGAVSFDVAPRKSSPVASERDGHSAIIRGGLWHYEYVVGRGHRWYRGERSTGWFDDSAQACACVRAMEEQSQ